MSTPTSTSTTTESPDGRPPEQPVNQAGPSARNFGTPHRPARGHGYEQRGLAYLPVSQLFEGRFGRMFRLAPYVPDATRIKAIAEVMLEGDSGTDSAPDNPDIPPGYTYLGQFIDHDLTFDPVSSLTRQNDPDALTNFRSPRFDLDCIYGRGPSDDAFLYDKDPGREDMLLIGRHDDEDDLPRNTQGTALLGDPRNDENTFVSQLQLTMLKFHNSVVEVVRADPTLATGSESVFETAQRIVRWHYQWVVVHDYLRRTVGQEMLDSVLDETGPVPGSGCATTSRARRRRTCRWSSPSLRTASATPRSAAATRSTRWSATRCSSPAASTTTRWATSAASASCRRSGRSSGAGSSRSPVPATAPCRRPG